MSTTADWAASGAMALTGRADGPPRLAPGRPASAVREALDRVAAAFPGTALPGIGLLGERAALAGLRRRGPWSCGGAFRAVRTADGWLGLSLPRPDDVALVPALVGSAEVGDPWAAVAAWAGPRTTAEAAERAALLGLAHAAAPAAAADRPAVVRTVLGVREPRQRPLVVDLTSLWAGPLCAHLLGLAGADVVKVESVDRPDGARRGEPRFFDLLHRGHREARLDFRADTDALRRLIAGADLVLEASRPRALRQLGIDAAEVVGAGTSWLSITARGRDSDTIGFGDDVAVAAGLYIVDGDDVLPCGDALADPLAGVTAAAEAAEALRSPEARLIDLSMLHVAAATTGPTAPHEVVRRGDGWWVEDGSGTFAVEEPYAR